jgi:CheY-like chemotaxis protein
MAKRAKKVRIFSALEVANICGVVNQTAINWIKSGYLQAFTTPGGQYRIYSDDLYQFLSLRGMRVPDELNRIIEEEKRDSKLLIVEDDAELSNLLKRFFNRRRPELTILQAFDGFEAGSLLSKSKPKVVVLDINLPGMDGYKLCRMIKSDSSLGSPLIIAITGLGGSQVREAILAEGADAFMAKPFNPSALLEKIDQLQGQSEEPR